MSNFQVDHLERLAAERDVVPAVNQIELHPLFLNAEVDAYGEEHGIVTEAWSPIAQGKVLDEPAIVEIADRSAARPRRSCCAGTSSAATWCSRSRSKPERMQENFELFDFELEPADVERIDALDRGEDGRIGPHPDRFAYVPR